MPVNVYTKAATDRLRGIAIGTLTLVAFLFLGMAVYRDIDLSVYTELPDVFRSLVGIEEGAGAGALAYSRMYTSYGALLVFSLALAMGSAAVAGEESKGTWACSWPTRSAAPGCWWRRPAHWLP